MFCIKFQLYLIFIFRFTNVVKSLENYEIPKIAKNRIYSLAIHPSETSLIVAAGDMKGNIGETNFYIKLSY